MWMRQTVFFKVAYRELPDRNKWRHWAGAEYRRTTLFHTTVSNWQALRVICFALPSQTGRPLGLFFISRKGPWSGVLPPKAARRRSSKHVYESDFFRRSSKHVYESEFLKEWLMGEIGCRRPHSTKLVDISSEIFIESASNLCAFFYEAPNDIICMAAPHE